MMFVLGLLAALLPAVLLWVYIWKKDPKPEPKRLLAKAVLQGALVCIPVASFEASLSMFLFHGEPTTLFGTTVMAFLVAAVPEETFKLLVLRRVLQKNPYYDEHFDGIVYAVSVGLGFAAVENVFYVLGNEDWMGIAIGRALLAVPGHYAFAVLMGYYYSVYHFVDHTPRAAVRILLVPVLAHGIYDSLAMSGMVNVYVGAICFLVLIYFCFKMHKFAQSKIVEQIERDQSLYTFPPDSPEGAMRP